MSKNDARRKLIKRLIINVVNFGGGIGVNCASSGAHRIRLARWSPGSADAQSAFNRLLPEPADQQILRPLIKRTFLRRRLGDLRVSRFSRRSLVVV